MTYKETQVTQNQTLTVKIINISQADELDSPCILYFTYVKGAEQALVLKANKDRTTQKMFDEW